MQQSQLNIQDIQRDEAERHESILRHLRDDCQGLQNDGNLLKQHYDGVLLRETEDKETIARLTQNLREMQAEHAHLRKHLQLADPEESAQIVNEFKSINRTVEDVARTVAEEALS